jgi:hypothetical protein
MVAKGADWIVLNAPSALNSKRTSVALLGAAGVEFAIDDRDKREVATRLVELLDLPEDGV